PITTHAAATGSRGLEPARVGLTPGYPGQSVVANHAARCRCRPRLSSTEVPLGANPYLCRSAEILVTRGTRRSHGFVTGPAPGEAGQHGSARPPRHASTCSPMLRSRDSSPAATSTTGSITPVG